MVPQIMISITPNIAELRIRTLMSINLALLMLSYSLSVVITNISSQTLHRLRNINRSCHMASWGSAVQ